MSPRAGASHVGTAVGADDPLITDDVFLGGALRLLQPRDGLRAGLDAVMLAAAVPVMGQQSVLDAGSGCGVVALAIARRCGGARVMAIEIEPELAALAVRNADRNGLAERVRVLTADLTQPLASLRPLGLVPETCDHVVANPPYHDISRVRVPSAALKARASAFAAEDLDRWARFLAAMAKPGGRLTMIHRADALADVLRCFGDRFGALRIHPLYPHAGAAASRILVQGAKGTRAALRLSPGMVLHDASGAFLPEAAAILRDGAALDIAQ